MQRSLEELAKEGGRGGGSNNCQGGFPGKVPGIAQPHSHRKRGFVELRLGLAVEGRFRLGLSLQSVHKSAR